MNDILRPGAYGFQLKSDIVVGFVSENDSDYLLVIQYFATCFYQFSGFQSVVELSGSGLKRCLYRPLLYVINVSVSTHLTI